MKKLTKVITLFIVILSFCEISYGAEYLNSVEFTEKSVNDTVIWSGREWITDTYPPKISQDGIEFIEVEGNEEIPNTLKFRSHYKYVWTGSDYLVYAGNHSYLEYNSPKYLYRISEDFKSILNTYEIPNWINYMEFIDDKVFIATENVRPSYREPGNVLSGVWSISRCEYEIYYSTDYIEWTKLDFAGYHLAKAKNKLRIDDNMYSNGNISHIVYETYSGYPNYKVGPYLCEIDYKNEYKTENNAVLAFSEDGIYWVYLIVDNKLYMPQKVSELGDEIIIRDDKKFYACNKEEIFSQLRAKIDHNPVYVKLEGNILGFETPPVIESGSTLVPMRFLFEQMGADVEWNGETQTATATLDNTAVTFAIDNTNAEVNNKPATMDVPARLINGKTMVPLRFLSEEMGFDVTWDAESRTAIIE